VRSLFQMCIVHASIPPLRPLQGGRPLGEMSVPRRGRKAKLGRGEQGRAGRRRESGARQRGSFASDGCRPAAPAVCSVLANDGITNGSPLDWCFWLSVARSEKLSSGRRTEAATREGLFGVPSTSEATDTSIFSN
jgi:hypothetical protein